MTKFYTNVFSVGNYIYHYYVDSTGCRQTERVWFKPTFGLQSDKGNYTDLFGVKVDLIEMESIYEASNWKKQYKETMPIFDDIDPVVQFIERNYKSDITPDFNKLKVFNLDIETSIKEGASDPSEANNNITAITVQDMYKNTFWIYGLNDYTVKQNNVKYIKCFNESDLLSKFIDFWSKERPDCFTSWNGDNFDIPYIINRSKKLHGEEKHLQLSPVNKIRTNKVKDDYGNETITYTIIGVQSLDMMRLYKKFALGSRESYSLNAISKLELGDSKVDYKKEYENLDDLYEKNFELFIDYNLKDTQLVADLNKKLKYIELAYIIAFMCKCSIEDIFGTVKKWECLIYKELKKRNMVLSPTKSNTKMDFPGGYVFEPIKGINGWISMFDITSSYPSTIITYNISPETLITRDNLPQEVQTILDSKKEIDDYVELVDTEQLEEIAKKYNIIFSANNCVFSKNKVGLFPELVETMFNERVKAKKEAKAIYKQIKDNPEEKERLENEYARLDGLQYALKIILNSFYGAFSNIAFRYFNISLASAVTCNAQCALRGPASYLNSKLGLSITYGDTDSLAILVDKLVQDRFKNKSGDKKEILEFLKKVNEKMISPKIKEYYEKHITHLNALKNAYKMDCEVISDRSLFVARKKYIMSLVHKDGADLKEQELKVTGVEIVRNSTPAICRKKLKELVFLILNTNDNKLCIDFIEKFKVEFNKLGFNEVSFPKGVRGFGKYNLGDKSVPINLRASLLYNKIIKEKHLKKYSLIREGDKIYYCYIKEPNYIGQNVIAFLNKIPEEFKELFKVDYEVQFEKSFLSPTQILFDCMEWSTKRVNSLDEWF